MTETAPSPWYPRAVLAGCMALSLAGNLMHAWHTYNGALFVWFAVAWAGIPPVAVPVLIELVGREARRGGTTAAFRWAVGLSVMLTVIAFAMSLWSLTELGVSMGIPWLIAVGFPVVLDLGAGTATLFLLDRAVADARSVSQGETGESEPESPVIQSDSADSRPAALPEPATNMVMSDDSTATRATQPATCGDAPASQPDDPAVTRDIGVSQVGGAPAESGDSPDPLLALAEHLVTQRRTTLSVEVTGIKRLYTTTVRTSAATAAVPLLNLSTTPTPKLTLRTVKAAPMPWPLRPITTPATSATISSGAAMRTAIHSACRVRSKIRFSSMGFALDRHPQDFLIGLDHLVTDGHGRFQRDLGLGDALHQVVGVALAGHGAGGGQVDPLHHLGEIGGGGGYALRRALGGGDGLAGAVIGAGGDA